MEEWVDDYRRIVDGLRMAKFVIDLASALTVEDFQ